MYIFMLYLCLIIYFCWACVIAVRYTGTCVQKASQKVIWLYGEGVIGWMEGSSPYAYLI